MAVAELNVSRRALLGAAFAVPPSRHPGLDPGSTLSTPGSGNRWTPDPVRGDEQWQQALARFRHAEARLKAHAHDPDEDRYDAVNAAFHNALRRLVRTPAPDLPALAAKIHLAVDHEVAELTGGEACLAALKRDATRLCLS